MWTKKATDGLMRTEKEEKGKQGKQVRTKKWQEKKKRSRNDRQTDTAAGSRASRRPRCHANPGYLWPPHLGSWVGAGPPQVEAPPPAAGRSLAGRSGPGCPERRCSHLSREIHFISTTNIGHYNIDYFLMVRIEEPWRYVKWKLVRGKNKMLPNKYKTENPLQIFIFKTRSYI